MTRNAFRTSLVIGLAAAARTAILFWLAGRVPRTGLGVIDDFLRVSASLFLGLFGDAATTMPLWEQVLITAAVNGALGFGVCLAASVVYKRSRGDSVSLGEHVT